MFILPTNFCVYMYVCTYTAIILFSSSLFTWYMKLKVSQLCLTLCDPMDCNLCPWNSPSKNTGVSNHFLLQGIFLTQGSNPGIPHCRQILYQLSYCFPGGASGKEPTCQCRRRKRYRFNPWVGKIPWRRK